jgi:ribonuclease BN (tRNA processing enzyme)
MPDNTALGPVSTSPAGPSATPGDTAWTDALTDLAAGSDLLIAESYYRDKALLYHLRHSDFVTHRAELASRHIILTHTSADILAHANDAAFDLAYDGRVVTL